MRPAESMSSTKQTRSKSIVFSVTFLKITRGAGSLMISRWARALRRMISATLSGSDARGTGTETRTRADTVIAHAVAHDARDEVGVRHDQCRAIRCLDLGGADVDAADIAFSIAHHHEIADADRALPQQDQPGDEVVDDGLQAETDTDRQGTGDDRQPFQAEAEIAEGDHARGDDTHVTRRGADRIPQAGIEIGRRQEGVVEPALNHPRHRKDGGEQQRRDENRRDRDRHIADVEAEKHRADGARQVGRFDTPGRQHEQDGDDDQAQPRDAVRENANLFQRTTPQARIGLERGDDAALRAKGVADEFIGNVDAPESGWRGESKSRSPDPPRTTQAPHSRQGRWRR